MGPATQAKRITIVSSGDAAAAIVLGDPVRLRQILWNLLSNAVKFTPDGGTVRVSLRVARGRVSLEVTDSGIGIEAGFLSQVFERFSQSDMSPTRNYSGLGTGLAIVRGLVEMHGGTVQASSTGAGQGATFIVELPLYVGPADTHSEGECLAEPALLEATSLNGVRVLIIDDDQDTRDTIALILETAGASTVIAESASLGLRRLVECDVDVVCRTSRCRIATGSPSFETSARWRTKRNDACRWWH